MKQVLTFEDPRTSNFDFSLIAYICSHLHPNSPLKQIDMKGIQTNKIKMDIVFLDH